MQKRVLILAVFAIALVATGWFLFKPREPRAVFLVVVDTLRPDRLSCYGSDDQFTPEIDRLAASGTLFTNAQSTASWTIPSMASILTSLYPSQLGLVERPVDPPRVLDWRDRRNQIANRLSQDVSTLPERLAHQGFHTAAFVNQPAIHARRGFDQGFDEWFVPTPSGLVRKTKNAAPGADRDGLSWKDQSGADLAVVDGFVRWLAKARQRRIFVWVHLLSPHMPYNPPRFYRVAGDRAPIDRYDAEIRYVDRLIGRVVSAIETNVGLDNTLIIFASDHGEEFGEHGMFEHGHSLHREVMSVPLILAGSGIPAGLRVETLVSTIDIMPTALHFVGHSPTRPGELAGRSLMPVLEAQDETRTAFAEGMLYGSTERVIIDAGYKLMFDEQQPHFRLYDPLADPSEQNDLAPMQVQRVDSLSQRLEDIHERSAGYAATHLSDVADTLVTPEERERIRRAMRALGYIND